jgi:hypothetical protein
MQLAQACQLRDRRWKFGQAIVGDTKLNEIPHGRDDLGEYFERVLADVEVPQALQATERSRKLRQPVIMQIKEVAQRFETAETG